MAERNQAQGRRERRAGRSSLDATGILDVRLARLHAGITAKMYGDRIGSLGEYLATSAVDDSAAIVAENGACLPVARGGDQPAVDDRAPAAVNAARLPTDRD